jgi:hypothetical protein
MISIAPAAHTTTPRWDREALATLGFIVVLALVSAAVSVLVLHQPSDGCVVDDTAGFSQRIHACYGERSTPLLPEDEILAAGDSSLVLDEDDLWNPAQVPAGWGAGATIDYTVRRAGAMLTLPVPIDPLSSQGIAAVFAYTLAGDPGEYILYVGFLLIFLLAPQSIAARALFLCFGAHFAVTKLGWAGSPVISATAFLPDWLFPPVFFLTSFWIWLFWPSLILLVLSFPRRVWPVSRAPRTVIALLYAIPVVAGLFTLVTNIAIVYGLVLIAQLILIVVVFVIVPIHTFLRVRDPIVRAQTGWLLLSLGIYLVPVAIFFPISVFDEPLFDRINAFFLTPILYVVLTALTPLGFGIAITRYRLFDISVVIRRTLVYTLLTLLLGAVYLGSVVGLQALFVQLTGQESTLAVVASTLGIVALFGPVRRRVQAFIDWRFFRQKYDAQQVVASFAHRAQQEANLDALSADLLATVQETLEPEDARLWLVRR